MSKLNPYRRVARERQCSVGRGGWISLYLAHDHLLLRRTVTVTETYHRFYLADVEAISIRKTPRWHIWTTVWVFAIALCLIAMLAAGRPTPTAVVFAIVFVICGAINVARGATCVTQLQTRVQTRALPLRRVRKAVRALNQLSPAIAAAQAEIATGAETGADTGSVHSRTGSGGSAVPPPLPGEQLPLDRSPAHAALFALLIVGGLIAGIESLQPQSWLPYVVYAFLLLNITAAIGMLVLQGRRRYSPRLTKIAWVSAIFHGVALPTAFTVYSWVYAFHRASSGGAPRDDTLALQMKLSALRGMPGFDYVLIGYAVFAVGLGVAGCVLLLTQPHRTASAPEP